MSRLGRERGWSPITRAQYDAQTGPTGAFLIGTAEDVAEKIDRHCRALGGINRFCFMMENAVVPNEKIMHTIELIGGKVKPMLG